MSDEEKARQDLERLFPKPFSDYQWSLISAQGYGAAIDSGERSAEEVAEELRGLMRAAEGRSTTAPASVGDEEAPLSWDEMEKLVLGRILARGEAPSRLAPVSERDKSSAGDPPLPTDRVSRVRRRAADRERARRLWWTVLGASVVVLALALLAVIVLAGPQCADRGSSLTTVTTEPVGGWVVPTEADTTSAEPGVTTTNTSPLFDYSAYLSGDVVVPRVETEAAGNLELKLSEGGETLGYVLRFEGLTDLTAARLYVGPPGANGDEIAVLYEGPTIEGSVDGVAAEGSLQASDLIGPLQGRSIQDFIDLVEEGSVYVVAATTSNPDGELRGRLE